LGVGELELELLDVEGAVPAVALEVGSVALARLKQRLDGAQRGRRLRASRKALVIAAFPIYRNFQFLLRQSLGVWDSHDRGRISPVVGSDSTCRDVVFGCWATGTVKPYYAVIGAGDRIPEHPGSVATRACCCCPSIHPFTP
jgi:hypothetical protein